MEPIVTSNQIHEQITAFVAERVDEAGYRSKVQASVAGRPESAAVYEQELAAMLVVRGRAPRPTLLDEPPGNGADHTATAEEPPVSPAQPTAGTGRAEQSGGGFLTSGAGLAVALIVAIVCGVVVYRALTREDEKIIVEGAAPVAGDTTAKAVAKGPENIFNKADDNFTRLRQGDLAVQHAASDQADLAQYFKENGVAYTVAFPQVQAPLSGGIISQHGATRLAHVVYASGETSIYLLEVPLDILRKGDIVYVPGDAMKQLEEGRTLWEEPGGHSLAMFKKGDVVCVVVSNARREELGHLVSMK